VGPAAPQTRSRLDPDALPATIGADLATYHYFRRDLERLRPLVHRTHLFGWHPPGSPLRACHCIDLPFIFGNPDEWRHAPMLHAASNDEIDRLTRATQSMLVNFAHGS
jgi:carboxylesterase type B